MVIIIIVSQAVIAEEKINGYSVSPFLNYSILQFEEQQIQSPGLGVILTKGNLTPPISVDRNSIFIAAVYKQYFVNEVKDGYKDFYHDITMLADIKIKQHLVFGVFSSQAAVPVYEGLHTFTAGIGYGYELLRNENVSLTLGGGLVVADFGIELSDGTAWPILPLPIVRFNVNTSLFNASVDFQKNIVTSYTFLPGSKIRLSGSLIMEPFDIRSIRDIYYDNTLWYRFFTKDSKMGDFAGIGLGFRNTGFRFALSERTESYKVNYYYAYGILDFSFLGLSGGYLLEGREIYNGKNIEKIGNGFFLSAFLAWKF